MNQKKKKGREKGKKRRVLLAVNAVFVLILLASLVIPSKGKKVLFANMDISMYDDLDSIPAIGAVTDKRPAKIRFQVYGERLYGICLYFYVDGGSALPGEEKGMLTCTLKSGEEEIGVCQVSVRELASLMSQETLNGRELVFDCKEELSGEYTLEISGEGIPDDTRVALYGNKSDQRHLEYVNAGHDLYNGILYSLEAADEEHPFVWPAALLLALSFLFSCMMNDGEKN